MATLSLCMIVKNEERTLGRVLEAARQFCDEMIVVDTGSTDRTVEIAESYGARVEHFAWIDDFAAARNYSFSKATGEWIIWLDADDAIAPEMIEKLKYVKQEYLEKPVEVNGFMVMYNYAFDKVGPDRKVVLALMRERIIRRSCGFQWAGRIHETIDLRGESKLGRLDGVAIDHETAEENEPRKVGRNLAVYDQYLDTETCGLHDLFQYGGELQAAKRYDEAVGIYKKYIFNYGNETRDSMGERYSVLIKMAECHRMLKNSRAAVEACGLAIADDGSRAEAFGLIGMTRYEDGDFAAAFPAFLAAAACKPPAHGGLCFAAFYGEPIHDMIRACKEQLGHPPMQEKLDKPAE